MAEQLPAPETEQIDLGAVFSALADPLRREAIAILATLPDDTERSCVSFGFTVAKASLTHHFKVMREAGLIHQFNYGNRRACTLRRYDIEGRFPGLLAMLSAELHERN